MCTSMKISQQMNNKHEQTNQKGVYTKIDIYEIRDDHYKLKSYFWWGPCKLHKWLRSKKVAVG